MKFREITSNNSHVATPARMIRSSFESKQIVIFTLILLALSSAGTAQTVRDVYSFTSTNSSQYPGVVPAQGRDGKLYVTTAGLNYGSVFRVSTTGKGGTELHVFDGTDGEGALGVILATDGNFYGATSFGGSFGYGVLFKVTPGGTYTELYNFTGGDDGAYPFSSPIEASDGNLYGTTLYGANMMGATVYKYTRAGTFTTISQLSNTQAEGAVGLIQGADGNLYGTSANGGTSVCGSIFRLTTSGTLLNSYSFPCGAGGAFPSAPLVLASDGNYYGTTSEGGNALGDGTIFRMTPNFAVSILYDFRGGTDGRIPDSGLTQATDGNLYGVTSRGGGSQGNGTLFQVTTAGTYKLLYSFKTSIGQMPLAAPLQDTNGVLYGTVFRGGASGYGAIYSLNMGLGPFITFVSPTGRIGSTAQILGQGLTGTTGVTFNGVAASSFSVVSDTYMTAVVPSGATTGTVVVTTPSGALTSNVSFRMTQ